MRKIKNSRVGAECNPFYTKKPVSSAYSAYYKHKITKPQPASIVNSLNCHARQQSASIQSLLQLTPRDQEKKGKIEAANKTKYFRNISIEPDIINRINNQPTENLHISPLHTPIVKMKKSINHAKYFQKSIHEESFSFSDDLDFNLEESDHEQVHAIRFFEVVSNKQAKNSRAATRATALPEEIAGGNMINKPGKYNKKVESTKAHDVKSHIFAFPIRTPKNNNDSEKNVLLTDRTHSIEKKKRGTANLYFC